MILQKKKVIFVPGYGGLEEKAWPEWLERELTKCGFDFIILDMPDPTCPQVDEWVNHIEAQNFVIDDNTYFIGYSLGCVTLARFFTSLPVEKIARGCIFVAGFCSLPKIPLVADFCYLPLDFSEAKKHAREFVSIISSNDHFIPCSASEEFAEKFSARIIIEENCGHFRSDIKEIDSVLNSILEMEQMKEEEREIEELKKI
jgi:uncharacterized protein